MLRTIAGRSAAIRGTLRRPAFNNLRRALVTEGTKKLFGDRPHHIASKHTPQQWSYQIVRYYSDYPKHSKVVLPALSPTMEEGKIVNWAKKEGDKLNEGDLLAEIETDKATMAFETPEEGYLAKILIPAGTKGIPVGRLVCILVENEADVAAFKDYKADASAGPPPKAAAAEAPSAPSPQPASPPPPPPSAPAAAAPSAPHTKVKLPALSPTMEEGKLVSWSKKEGDKLNEGDVLAEIETDKATMAFETPEEGYLAKILIPAGTKGIKIGQLVCVIVENQSDVAAFANFTAASAEAVGPAPAARAPPQAPSAPAPSPSVAAAAAVPPPPPVSSGGRVYASPMARRLAEQRNIRLQGKGTGMFGSITSKDLDAMASAPPPISAPSPSVGIAPPKPAPMPSMPVSTPGPYKDIPVSNVRGIIAKRLLQSKTTIPHYYLTANICVDKLLELRALMNAKLEKKGIKISVNDFIIKAVAQACLKAPEANSVWMDSFIRQHKNVDVSVAVTTPTGLITPIIFEANNKGIIDISKEVKILAQKARENKLQPHEFQGGTISVSNLGMFGVSSFDAIINPGQSCILAVGTTEKRLEEDAKAEKGYRTATYISVTLSCDHRVVDGAEGAKWLQAFHSYLENPVNMIF